MEISKKKKKLTNTNRHWDWNLIAVVFVCCGVVFLLSSLQKKVGVVKKNIILFGLTASGKSTLLDSLIKLNHFRIDEEKFDGTQKTRTFIYGDYRLIDTPGLNNATMSYSNILSQVQKGLMFNGPYLFVAVLNPDGGRFNSDMFLYLEEVFKMISKNKNLEYHLVLNRLPAESEICNKKETFSRLFEALRIKPKTYFCIKQNNDALKDPYRKLNDNELKPFKTLISTATYHEI